MSYSLDSIDMRTEEIYSIVRPVCLVAFAERRAARASDIAMPSASDVSGGGVRVEVGLLYYGQKRST